MENAVHATISPELSVRRGREAVEFYEAAFGAVEIYRVGGTEENEDLVAQLSIGASSPRTGNSLPRVGHRRQQAQPLPDLSLRPMWIKAESPSPRSSRARGLAGDLDAGVRVELGEDLGDV
jgi:hypothetical protein